ncbi:hypothetical protein FH972_012930 [Carpinus fangiana]|uniref:Uncharacterized protein n=1 Tax=Carpinus fangiana TaxID=176857 RepID=A0A5N6R5H4_9ROSI|nr:hypothetical protein FH972_012930 [Carpinus fangiana]
MVADAEPLEILLHLPLLAEDKVNARATYNLSFGGACPDLFLLEGKGASTSVMYLSGDKISKTSYPIKREWTLYMPKAYNPLLLQQHRQNLQMAGKDVSSATALIKRGEIDAALGELRDWYPQIVQVDSNFCA